MAAKETDGLNLVCVALYVRDVVTKKSNERKKSGEEEMDQGIYSDGPVYILRTWHNRPYFSPLLWFQFG